MDLHTWENQSKRSLYPRENGVNKSSGYQIWRNFLAPFPEQMWQ